MGHTSSSPTIRRTSAAGRCFAPSIARCSRPASRWSAGRRRHDGHDLRPALCGPDLDIRAHQLVGGMRVLAVLLLLVVGCTTPMPRAPVVATSESFACVDHCQARYEGCIGASQHYLGIGAMAWAAQAENRQALNACRDNLAACYQSCRALGR